MGYLLIKPEVLVAQGIENYEVMPDGRAIVDYSMLKVLGSVEEVEVVSTTEEMLAKIEEEKESGLYDNPIVQQDDLDPSIGVIPEGEQLANGEAQKTPQSNSNEDENNSNQVQPSEQENTKEVAPSVDESSKEATKEVSKQTKKGGDK